MSVYPNDIFIVDYQQGANGHGYNGFHILYDFYTVQQRCKVYITSNRIVSRSTKIG